MTLVSRNKLALPLFLFICNCGWVWRIPRGVMPACVCLLDARVWVSVCEWSYISLCVGVRVCVHAMAKCVCVCLSNVVPYSHISLSRLSHFGTFSVGNFCYFYSKRIKRWAQPLRPIWIEKNLFMFWIIAHFVIFIFLKHFHFSLFSTTHLQHRKRSEVSITSSWMVGKKISVDLHLNRFRCGKAAKGSDRVLWHFLLPVIWSHGFESRQPHVVSDLCSTTDPLRCQDKALRSILSWAKPSLRCVRQKG